MTRNHYSLDGSWDFIYDADSQLLVDHLDNQQWREILVPSPWQAQIEGLEESTGTGWYRKHFKIDTTDTNAAYILHFGAAYHYAQVWLNGHYLGDHEGGWLPFEFAIEEFIRPDVSNELIVRVVLPNNNIDQYPDFPATEILHGKQSWYGAWGGLWQSVYIEQRSSVHIKHLRLQMDADNHIITTIELNQWHDNLQWRVDLYDPDGQHLQQQNFGDTADRIESENLSLAAAPQLWSPVHPHLYTVCIQLLNGDIIIDEVTKTSGFRTISTENGKILLNGKPFYMRGALDQDYYPQTIATSPSEEFLRDQFQKAKDMGLNTLRMHIKVADPRYYQLADEMGLLLWVDLPNWTILSERTKSRIQATLEGMVKRDGHHPSIAIWTIVNEDWGTDLVHNADHRRWLNNTYHWLKSLDPTRLVVDNSPCKPNFHIESDITDYHYYRGIPDHRDEWDRLTKRLATDHSFTYSPHGDARYTNQEPIIVSEFGNWGLPDVDNLLDKNGDEPWWFETGSDWGEGVVYPHGIKRRFKQWKLDKVFGSFETLTEMMQWQQYEALKYEIESIRTHPQIQGYIVTELTDTHWENNGLMDMNRQPRIFADRLTQLNANELVIAQFNRHAYHSAEKINIKLRLSVLSKTQREITAIEWQLGNKDGGMDVDNIQVGINDIGTLSTHLSVAQSEKQSLKLYLHFKDGTRILSNEYPVYIYHNSHRPQQRLAVDDNDLKTVFEKLGYTVTSDWDDADIVITTKTNDALRDYIASGGRALIVANQPDALPHYESGYVIYQDFPFARMMDRRSTIWNGDWVSTFSWLSPSHRIFDTSLIDDQFIDIIPDYVLTGFQPSEMPYTVGAALFVGWIHRPVALLGYRRYHRGKIAVTTFKLHALDTHNPAQQHLISMIFKELVASKVSLPISQNRV